MFEPFPSTIAEERGMIDMELLRDVRRWRYRQHFSIREIARRTRLSRNTLRKYLRSDSAEPKFRSLTFEQAGSFADRLAQMLRQEAVQSRIHLRAYRKTKRGQRRSKFGSGHPSSIEFD
ncbi:hypothetical protein C5688_18945 [Methylocystis sp. MitZ-2018]|nr:hypothetical protein C5688_18945 [Methylocystis sp. MitZ-2018]